MRRVCSDLDEIRLFRAGGSLAGVKGVLSLLEAPASPSEASGRVQGTQPPVVADLSPMSGGFGG